MEQVEQEFICPCCGQPISMLLDLSVEHQVYTEDCEICCRPLEIRYSVENGEVNDFTAQPS